MSYFGSRYIAIRSAGPGDTFVLERGAAECSSFTCGSDVITLPDKYTYLGLVFNEFLDYNVMARAVSDSANRARGLVISKFKSCGGMPFDVYLTLYNACVIPIINYGSVIWGFKEYSCINSIQNRAGCFFLGVDRYTPHAAVNGDMGWRDIQHVIWNNISNKWCKYVNISDHNVANFWCKTCTLWHISHLYHLLA